MSRVEARKVLEGLLGTIRPYQIGRHCLWLPTSAEISLFNCLTSTMRAMPAFDEDGLFNEFAASLVANKLISPRGVGLLAPLKGPIALFALSLMHQSIIDLGDGTEACLDAHPRGNPQGQIIVSASTTVGKMTAVSPIFITSQTLANCEATLQQIDGGQPWPFPLEVTAAKRLARL